MQGIRRSFGLIREMEGIAWILRSDPKRKEIVGFVHGSKLRVRERFTLDEE